MLHQRRFILLIIAAIIVSFSAGCKPTSLVSTKDEVEIGKQAAEQVEKEYKVVTDPAVNRLVNTIGQNLVAQSEKREGITYTFKVLKDPSINAFALPGGHIYLFSGLIDSIGKDENMLAAVIGHEIGHVAAKHHAEMMGRSTIYGIAIGVLTEGNTQQWANIFANLTLLKWSRKHELQADQLSVKYLYGSNDYKPEGVVHLLELLQSKGGDSKFLPFLQTHPLTSERIDRAKYWIQYYQDEAPQ